MSEHPLRDSHMAFSLDTMPEDAAAAFKRKHGKMPDTILYPIGDVGQFQTQTWLEWSVRHGITLACHMDALLLVYAGPIPKREAQR